MRFYLKPSISIRLTPQEATKKWHGIFYYAGGTKQLVVELDDTGHQVVQELILGGSEDGKHLQFFHDRQMLISDELRRSYFNREQFDSRTNSFLLEMTKSEDEFYRARAQLDSVKICIIGLGGIGCNVAHGLVRAGIKDLLVVDRDTVSPSNLNRQSLFYSSDVGRSKVEVVAARLRDISSELIVRCIMLSMEHLSNGDLENRLVINCADEPEIFANTLHIFDNHPCVDDVIIGGGYYAAASFIGPLISRRDVKALRQFVHGRHNAAHQQGVGGNTFSTAMLPTAILLNEIFNYLCAPDRVAIRNTLLCFDWVTLQLARVPMESM